MLTETTDRINEQDLMEYKLGDKFKGYLIIREVEMRKSRAGDLYISITVADKSGELSGNIWDAAQGDDDKYPVGSVAMVSGEIGEYNNRPQINYDNVTVITDGRPEADPKHYIRTAPVGPDVMLESIKDKIETIEYDDVKAVVREILNKYSKDLFTHAAANKLHHAYQGGLGFHIISMLKIADNIVSSYPDVDHSLLYAGIILHDIGKIEELTPVLSGSEYTTKGKLLGHISIIETEIVVAAIKLGINPNSENVILLRHLVLSHHGRLEWGSAVLPQTKEAHALHYIDMLDARMNMTHEALIGVEKGEFSPNVWALEKSPVYHPTEERGIIERGK